MARFVDAIDVPVPIEEAHTALADFSRTVEWDPGVVATKRLTQGPPGVGSRYRVIVSFLGQRLPLDYEITAMEAPHRVVLVGEDDNLRSYDEITFAPTPTGTRITYDARLTLKGIRALADPALDLAFQVIGGRASRGLRRWLTNAWERGALGPKPVPEPTARAKRARAAASQARKRSSSERGAGRRSAPRA